MKDENKTKDQLIDELARLRQRMADFEQPGGPGTVAAGFLKGTRNQIFFHYFLGGFER